MLPKKTPEFTFDGSESIYFKARVFLSSSYNHNFYEAETTRLLPD